ncbi:MAG: alpha-amylase family glycosyl hydrolase, partial [Ardenticatenaceae bacterium]
KLERDLTLMEVPDDEWRRLARQGFDYVWLMGVWQRSAAGRRVAIEHQGLRKDYADALPDWTEADVTGSPYAVRDYRLDPLLGGQDELRALKARLNSLGLGLIVDFVSNHVAIDHPWTLSHPDWFVRADEKALEQHPDWFYSPDGKNYLAHGKDPYFPPWTDTAQINYSSTEVREALTLEMLKLAEVSDGARCDMAMLAVNSVFLPVWEWTLKGRARPKQEFWPDAINRVKARHPDFLFMAEVYWGMERELQQMGFDFTYDKVLYDKLRYSKAAEVGTHLMSVQHYQSRMARFIENHDEARAVTAFGRDRSRAAAIVTAHADAWGTELAREEGKTFAEGRGEVLRAAQI